MLSVVMGLLFVGAAAGQDARNVLEPVIPALCTTLNAELGSGATAGTISSETQLDSAPIQALNACPAGQALELGIGARTMRFLRGR